MSNTLQLIQSLLIASVTPQNLERGTLWFPEHAAEIRRARGTNPWWKDNTIEIEMDKEIKPSVFLRSLAELGYNRVTGPLSSPGLFKLQGGIVEVWPINTDKPYLIEFHGNTIESIHERLAPESKETTIPPSPLSFSIDTLKPGSFVVHVDHGIGIFRGISSVENENTRIENNETSLRSVLWRRSNLTDESFINESYVRLPRRPDQIGTPRNDTNERFPFESAFFIVEYAAPAPNREPDRLYVPVTEKDRLSPYVGFEMPRIHRLGGTLWFRTKRKAREDAEKMARELLALYAKRNTVTRPPHHGDSILEDEVRTSFPHMETEDQLKAEEEILSDLTKPIPMDRVLCGDVGFGKTEIALRAAMHVITSGRQVAILSPTTILAAQHERTAKERTVHVPVSTVMLSRLTPRKQEGQILEGIRKGTIDLVIGTHRLLSKDISFKQLGLVIIDEEQRFGVRQKERFKDMRTEVDVLSLSATPIPRTLQFTLSKLRDISFLQTPPPDRLPIKTFVLPYGPKIIREAVNSELDRGGQIYFLHNRIDTIGRTLERIKRLMDKRPVSIGIIHGRMGEKDILAVMNDFREKKLDMLLATTIIENGLDISNANTLIVDDATRLGLAQAHQLRGRIGRANVQAYAYFLYKPRHLTAASAERLAALQEYSYLGAGYKLALCDMELRGAGNILGREQSGAINKVGLNLYYTMLSEAIEEMKSGLP